MIPVETQELNAYRQLMAEAKEHDVVIQPSPVPHFIMPSQGTQPAIVAGIIDKVYVRVEADISPRAYHQFMKRVEEQK